MTSSAAARFSGLSPTQLLDLCRYPINRWESHVQAWQHLDLRQAWNRARDLEDMQPGGLALYGIPVGVKDTIDVAGLPCERGTAACRGRIPDTDAEVCRRLQAAGANIIGKTVTTELAVVRPGPTRNPWNTRHTPGGSSSGSAAAVAASMVPAAIGTQTIGSTLRPASYCGVVGFKPSQGAVPLDGVLAMSPLVDSIGILGVSVAVVDAVYRAVADDVPSSDDGAGAQEAGSVAVLRSPWWPDADRSSRGALAVAAQHADELGFRSEDAAEVPWLENLIADQWQVVYAGIASWVVNDSGAPLDSFGPEIRSIVERNRSTGSDVVDEAEARIVSYRSRVEEIFQGHDFIITPCVTGEAPEGLMSTGSPVFCQPWSALGLPAVALPMGLGPTGLPVGAQVVARAGDDLRLLEFAGQLYRTDFGGVALEARGSRP